MLTGLSSDSFQNMQLNAGILLRNFTYSSATDASSLMTLVEAAKTSGGILGATLGGGTFSLRPTMRQIEADGVRGPFVDSKVIDMWDGRLSTTVKELTANNLKDALITADVSTDTGGKVTTIKVRTEVKSTDYIDNIVWIGERKDGALLLICLYNALNTNGCTFNFRDRNEGTLALEYQAHYDDVLDQDEAPVDIKIFDLPDPVPGGGSGGSSGSEGT